ncbi:MAG: protein-glutamate O-methyltransferase [Candidatus Eisenbacteria bacterium]|nr:protein-glutamate O-methyltransferase [Candidatus Eisenbacteria bacterium]
MDQALFRKFCKLAHDKAGIHLKEGKESLVQARVAKRLRALGLDHPREYLEYMERDESGEELVLFLDVISTNFTNFFREPDHFDVLAEDVKRLVLEKGRRRIRLWSAASSSGEEPYTMAITVLEALEGAPADFRILATDISTRMLARAEEGVYAAGRLEGVPKAFRHKYFERIGRRGSEEESYRIRPAVRERVVFRRLNLADPPFPMQGPLDVVFCRNVMIYFDQPVRQRLVSEIERLLAPGGLLCIGHSETLSTVKNHLKYIRSSVFRNSVDAEVLQGAS